MENNPGGPVTVPVQRKFFDRFSMVIIGGAAVLAGLFVLFTYPKGYRHARNTAMAERYRAERDYDRALPYLEAIVRQYPGAWMQVKNLGDCYLFKKKPDPKAALQYYQLVQQSADYQSYINNPQVNADEKQLWVLDEEIGICYAEMGDRPNAQAYFSKVLETSPDNPAVNYYLGVDYFEKGDYAKAAKCFQYAATFDQVKPPETNDTETPRQGTKWGDLWDKRAAPYREKIAQLTLGKAPEAPGKPQGGGKG